MSGRRVRILGAGGVLLLASVVSSCVPVQSLRYPKIGYDNNASGYSPAERELRVDTVAGLRLAWRRDLHLDPYTSLTVGRRFVYAIDGGRDLVALDRRTGAIAWEAAPDTVRGSF